MNDLAEIEARVRTPASGATAPIPDSLRGAVADCGQGPGRMRDAVFCDGLR